FKNELHEIPIISPQASFLAWVDFRVLNLNDADLNRFLVEKAGVGLSPGVMYGQEGSGFMRLNFGLNKAQLIEKLEKIKVAIKQKIG
ncbi:MAG: aminotransferase, partial [Bacteroidales bacterium]|nr:aminotransferase [Bacteroidales bacterium]